MTSQVTNKNIKERPIIFSTEMVKAILEDRKTQTRRLIKPQPYELKHHIVWAYKKGYLATDYYWLAYCPYGQVGAGLWVRETWTDLWMSGIDLGDVIYKATPPNAIFTVTKWHPAIFMPRWASRITLEITKLRVERLQEIGLNDLEKEGLSYKNRFGIDFTFSLARDVLRREYAELWNSLNAKRGYGWGTNPWVWVISFGRLE